MFNKSALVLILCSLSILASAYSPNLQKSYFSLKPNSTFSYEFPLTSKGVFAHYFDNSAVSKSKIFLLGLTNGDAFPVLEDTISACQTATPIFQPIHYHVQTDTLVYYCAFNNTLLIIDQGWQTVSASIPLGLGGVWPTAKLSTDGMNVSVLAMDSLFSAFPKTSALVKVDMQSRKVASQMWFNQNLTSGEAVVAYTTGIQGTYIATNRMENNNVITKLYYLTVIGTTYKMYPLSGQVDLTSSKKTITKLFALGNYLIVNCDTTLYFLNNLGMMVRLDHIHTKELTPGIFHPAVVPSADGSSFYIHTDTLEAAKYTIIASGVFYKSLGLSQDLQIGHANQTSSDLMFTYDPSGVSFNIIDLQTLKYIRTIPASYADLMLTDKTYTVVQTNTTTTSFNIFDLKTDYLVMQVVVPLTTYYHNKDQHIITFISKPVSSSCQVTHLDLVSGKYWTTLSFTSSSDACSSYVSDARITEKGTPELVIPTNQSFLIISETYGQTKFYTNSATHETDSLNINFDDLSFYYLTANQAALQVRASFYAFDPQTQSFEFKKYNYVNLRPVKKNGFFTINQNMTATLSDVSISVFNTVNALYFFPFTNNYNLVSSFQDSDKTTYMFFSHFSADSQYSQVSAPALLDSYGRWIAITGQRTSTVSGQATSARSYALYDSLSSSVSLVRFFNVDYNGPNVAPKSRWSMRIDGIMI